MGPVNCNRLSSTVESLRGIFQNQNCDKMVRIQKLIFLVFCFSFLNRGCQRLFIELIRSAISRGVDCTLIGLDTANRSALRSIGVLPIFIFSTVKIEKIVPAQPILIYFLQEIGHSAGKFEIDRLSKTL